jgi:phosphatidylserine/phosphatidylglycerophosphate/cardiolipin synthase-like enzyme
VIRDDAALFAAYQAYWDDLATDREDRDYDVTADGDSDTRVFFFPKASSAGTGAVEAATDPVHNLFDNVGCAGGTRVRVAMGSWTRRRGYLIDDLARLAGEGCDVGVVYNGATTEGVVETAITDAFEPDQAAKAVHLHSKYIVVDGRYAGEDHRLVWTGSHNFTHGGLRENDETLLRVEDDAIVDAFLADWDDLFARSRM